MPRPRAVRLAPQGRSLTARRAAIGGRAAATPAALLSALELVDEGHAPAAAASAARLPTRFLTDWLEIAGAWTALTTRRGELRLQPPDRAGLLAPDNLYNFVMHVFFGQMSAAFIGWADSSFQFKVGTASLGFAAVGFLAVFRGFDVRLAAIIGSSILTPGGGSRSS